MNNEDSEENLETLQEYIDWCFDVIVMKKNQNACSPAKSETPSSKRSRPADSPETTSPTGKSFTDILDSIDKRLSSFDARLSLVEILHREFKSLRNHWNSASSRWKTLAAENASLRDSVKSLTENMTHLSEENKKIKETVIDLQARSMRDNLVFSGIPESAEEDPEATVKNFIKTYLKLPEDTVENICFERVHRMGAKKPGAPRPRPIVAKFGYFKQKRAGEESRQGAERNRLRRKRPVPQRNPGATQNSVPNPTQSHPKGLPSCHRSGPALRGRTALPQHPYHSVVILTPLQIRIRYIYLFFLSFLACSSIYL